MKTPMSPLLVLLAACGSTPRPDAGTPYVPTQSRQLGLNDVTFLLPLESLDAGSPFPAASALLPLASFTRLTTAEPVVTTSLDRLRLVAFRFDLCDRATPTPCADDADASLRLVLQPVFATPPLVEDIALHAVFPIPRVEVPAVVDELRALAAQQDVPRSAALTVNAAFLADRDYRAKLGAFVGRYARAEHLQRLTLFGQETQHAALVWIFRGEELGQGSLQPITIFGVDAGSQEVLLFGGDSYQVTPLADAPPGFSRAVMEPDFRNSSPGAQRESVQGLLAVDNPTLHTSQTAQCVSCHLSTTLLAPRATDAGLDVTALPERYTAAPFDLSPSGPQTARSRTLRALGYFGSTALVSQRVINETAHVLGEVEARFPPVQP